MSYLEGRVRTAHGLLAIWCGRNQLIGVNWCIYDVTKPSSKSSLRRSYLPVHDRPVPFIGRKFCSSEIQEDWLIQSLQGSALIGDVSTEETYDQK